MESFEEDKEKLKEDVKSKNAECKLSEYEDDFAKSFRQFLNKAMSIDDATNCKVAVDDEMKSH